MADQTPPTDAVLPENNAEEADLRTVGIIAAVVTVVVVALLVVLTILMVQNPPVTEVLRDIAIIFMAVMLLFIGFTLIILLVQLARLTNLLQNEIKPILEHTNETINTVRGTAIFLSENVAEPVTKLNSYVAGVSRFVELIFPRSKQG